MTFSPRWLLREVTLTVETTDGDGASDTDSFKITISAVNDAPVVSLPAAQRVAKESTLTFNVANGNALSITDDASDSRGFPSKFSSLSPTARSSWGILRG